MRGGHDDVGMLMVVALCVGGRGGRGDVKRGNAEGQDEGLTMEMVVVL